MNVISLDQDRVKIYDDIVTKITNQNECDALLKATNKIKKLDKLNILDENYLVRTPKILDFSNGKITMEKCTGRNLEIMLRHPNTYMQGVNFTNSLLDYFIINEFYWKDFAPRNILIDKNIISIMDFERGLEDKLDSTQMYLVDSVYEEYGAFILPEDRNWSVDEVFYSNNECLINIKNISSKRVRTILNMLGYIDFVPISKYILAVKMIVVNEEPYKNKSEIIFPLLELEEYIKEHGHVKYAEKIIGGYNARKRSL